MDDDVYWWDPQVLAQVIPIPAFKNTSDVRVAACVPRTGECGDRCVCGAQIEDSARATGVLYLLGKTLEVIWRGFTAQFSKDYRPTENQA